MKRNIVFTIAVFLVCCVIIVLIVAIAGPPCSAIYVPEINGYDPNIDYMARMVEAAEDGSEWAIAMGRIYEQLRNEKIAEMKLDYEQTNFFDADAQKARDGIKAYLAPPVVEPEPEKIYLGLYWITGYDTCVQCCGKSDGITASGTYATAGRTVAASSEFDFGTRLWIDGIGERVVEDRGGAIGGGRLDVVCNDHAECYSITGWYDVWLIVEG